ncbi:MAG: HlyD family type I secretion periplasmic adaptor subunit [Gammaproteobacteria bacterium]
MAVDVERIKRTGLITILVVFGGLGVWLATAPLHGAVVAGGIVRVESNRKTVQHGEGGIVKSILVRDGDTVERGQTLIQLEDAAVGAQYGIARGALDAELARQARLTAEATMAPDINFPAELTARAGEAPVQEMQQREQALFSTRRRALEEQRELIRAQIGEIRKEIAALTGQHASEREAMRLADLELDSYEKLQDKAYVAEVRVLAQRRLVAEYQSRAEERTAESARAGQRIKELELRIAALGDEYASRAAEELKENSVRLLEFRERLLPSEDALRRQSITAPVAGRVIGLRVHTEGAVVGPRDPLLDIVPSGEAVLIEAQAPLDSIKQLFVGQEAEIRFTAMPYRTTPMVLGSVSYVSPDALSDREGRTFFQVHILPDADSLAAAKITSLEPGMAAEIYIQTNARTALQYLMRPIHDSLLKSFREN